MSENWNDAMAEAVAAVDKKYREIAALELIHPSIIVDGQQSTIKAVNDVVDRYLPMEAGAPVNPGQSVLFTAIPFSVPWPEVDEVNAPLFTLQIDDVGRELVPYLDAAVRISAALQARFRLYLLDETTGGLTQAMDPITIVMRQVVVNEQYVRGQASPADIANLQFLRRVYDRVRFPALIL